MTLDEVVVETTLRGNYLNRASLAKTETISRVGLSKMACCTVAESFENSAAVTVGYSDAVSGARQIKMLGLAGTYTQLLDESRSMMRGLAAPYSLDYTPGDWLKSIQVSKGVSSVTSGHEAITGQINLEYRKPTDDERLHLNFYLNDMLRPELNLTSAIRLKEDKSLSTIILAHGSIDTDWREMNAMDRNHDGFRDLPRTRQVDVANRWLWLTPGGMQLRWGARFTADEHKGGQFQHDYSAMPYLTNISNREASAYIKAALPIGDEINVGENADPARNNLALIADYEYFNTRATFGMKDYKAHENTASATLRYDHYFGGKSMLAVGMQGSLTHIGEVLREQVSNASDTEAWNKYQYPLGRDEREIGAFAEFTYHFSQQLTLVGGVREDYSHIYRKWMFTPRAHIKWDITPHTIMRLSGGTGFRSPGVINDNMGVLATGRQVLIQWQYNQTGKPEKAVNFGGSLTQTFRLGNDPNASVSIDYFRTQFSLMAYADQEQRPDAFYILPLDGHNHTNTWQIDINWTPVTRLDVMATFRYTDSQVTLPDNWQVERPLLNRFKGVLNVSYATKFRRWVFDVTGQLNGPARIPSVYGNLDDDSHSPTYGTLFAQVTHKIGKGEVYVGCENITDYRQRNLIVGCDQPFSSRFNASNVWGPVMGRRFYVGLRWNLY